MTETNFDKVGKFHDVFDHPKHTTPQKTLFTDSPETVKLRIALIREELKELEVACNNHDIVEVADALSDILYVTYGAGHVFGINLDKTFDEVQRSNMTKSCNNEEDAKKSVMLYQNDDRYGDPAYKKSRCGNYYIVYDRSTGKILKNYKYSAANLKKFVE
jgi:predicted HAD superfamily Cof-like phosphohydrolase